MITLIVIFTKIDRIIDQNILTVPLLLRMKKIYSSFKKPLNLISKTGTILAFSLFALLPNAAKAQTVVNEMFDALTQPALPVYWDQIKLVSTGSLGNDFKTVTSGTNPTVSPAFSAPNMVMFNSYQAAIGDASALVSVPYDFSNRGAASPTVSIRMWRDNTTISTDELEIYINTVPNMSGAPYKIGSIRRNRLQTTDSVLTETADGWRQYTFAVTNPAYNTSKNFILFKCTTGSGGSRANIYFDNLIINTFPKAMTIAGATTVQNSAPIGLGSTFQDVIRMEIDADGAMTPLAVTNMQINTGTTSSLSDISNARIFYTGLSNVFSTAVQYGATVPVITGNFNMSASANLLNGKNYFWVTYDVAGGATVGNLVDADWVDVTITSAGTITPNPQAPLGARPIAANYCQPTFTWGTSWPGDYIARVNLPGLNGIINNITGYAPHPPDYTYYPPGPGLTTTLVQGASYPMTTQVGTYCCQNNILVWIDFNKNGIFENYERMYEMWHIGGSYASGNQSRTAPFVVPNLFPLMGAASYGQTRMRVREIYANRTTAVPNTTGTGYPGSVIPDPLACNNIGYGETEDYIITIQPNCAPGTWLGFTDDWSVPSNWCDGVPNSASDITIPTVPVGGNMPVIYSNTPAATRDLTIANGASVTIKAPQNSSLSVDGNLLLSTATSKLDVTSNFTKTGVIGSGLLYGTSYTPYRGQGRTDHKIQMLYTAAELAARGFVAGDAFTALGFKVMGTQTTNAGPILNFKVGGALTAVTALGVSTGPWTFQPSPVINSAPGNFTPACGAPCPAGPAPGLTHAGADNVYPLIGSILWNGTSNLLVEACFDGSAGTNTWLVYHTQTTGVLSSLFNSSTAASDDGCAFTTAGTLTGGCSSNRPNLIINAFTPATVFPINVKGNWTNNGVFNRGISEVKFIGSALQTIGGSVTTTFNRVYIDKPGTNVILRMNTNVIVDSLINRSPTAGRGILDLNGYRLTINTGGNPALDQIINPVTGINNLTPKNMGWIMAETSPPAPLSWIQWNLGLINPGALGAAQTRTFPFITTSFNEIMVDLAGFGASPLDVGVVSATTYRTPPNNLPLPPGVIHINSAIYPGVQNDTNTVDRFWIIDKTGPSTFGVLRARWFQTEDYTGLLSGNAKFQQWKNPNFNGNPGWMVPAATSATVPAGATVRTANATFTSWAAGLNIFAVANNTKPLPIELLSFDAQLLDKKVQLKWVTASEKDNDFFTIERTRDGEQFQYVSKKDGAGNSSSLKEYYSVDPMPLKGLSYYRLAQTDYDGTTTHSDLVPITNTGADFDIAFLTQLDGELQIGFTYDSSEPVKLLIVDALGRQVFTRTFNEVEPGYNTINSDAGSLSKGVYFISLYNSQKSISRKLVY